MHVLKQLQVTAYDAPTNTVTLAQPIPPARATDTLNSPVTSPTTGNGITVTINFGSGAAVLATPLVLDGLQTVGRTVLFEIKTM
jgi:hypothetical protein